MRGGIIAASALLLGGCATSSLVLLNDEGGGHGAVAVIESHGKPVEQVVNVPDSRTALGNGRAVPRELANGLDEKQQALIAFLPPPRVTFTLYFEEGSTKLVPGQDAVIEAIRAEVDEKKRPGAELQVTGHTDRLGSDEKNDSLSEQRADDILKALITMGFDPALMSAVGRGERQPLIPTEDGAVEPKNRRVEIIIR